ncbi:MAG: hypothetical protein ABSG14_09610 [Verrucomicrobiia bacterium]|jgi:DNA-directed RNA polymerase subunit RPC12/RpoP
MDISFTCDKCGKNLVIDDAAAGITIDCPECGKAVYVPSVAPASKPKEPPARVEPKPLNRVPSPAPAPVSAARPRNNPLVPSYSATPKSAVHPSIAAGVHCLGILVAIEFVGFFVIRQNFLLIWSVLVPCEIFGLAAFLCAVYGMCIGHVRHGLLVLAGLALIVSMSCWIAVSIAEGMTGASQRQMQEMMQRQLQDFQKAFPLPSPHP